MMAAMQPNRPAFMDGLRGQLLMNEPMSRHTSWRVGGKAEYFYTPADKADLVKMLKQLPVSVPVYWVGLGSNLLVRDGGVDGMIVRTARGLSEIEYIEPNITEDCFLESEGKIIGFYITKLDGKIKQLIDGIKEDIILSNNK